MSGDLSLHHLSLHSSLSLFTIMQEWMYSLQQQPFHPSPLLGLLEESSTSSLGIASTILFSRLLVMPFKWCLLCLEELHPSASSPGCSSPSRHHFPVSSPIQQHGQIGLSTLSWAKELRIFWYGDKSQDLSSLVVPKILNMEGKHGSLENGFSYECRSLLIKALHYLIERSVWKFFPLFGYKMVLTNNF